MAPCRLSAVPARTEHGSTRRRRLATRAERRWRPRQKYAAVRYKQQIERAHDEDTLVPAVARIVRKPTLGFGHLAEANRPDLMVETLVLDTSKPYHHFFTPKTIQLARERMAEYAQDLS